MVSLLRQCETCKKYTLKTTKCHYCDSPVHIPHPAKYSPHDKYAQYRVATRPQENH